MKRKLLTLAVILALIVPARAQEKEEKMKELEKLEQQTEKATPPDTLINEEALLLAKYLRNERKDWIPRLANINS